jgi:3-hydroxybutyryl-CoA dehydrogenase
VTDAELIIEAVLEDINIKKALFKEADKYCTSDVIIASNTSALSISDLALVTNRPERVVGLHFFNPPGKMKLVEVVQGLLTSQDTIDDVVRFSEKIGKTALIVKDTPGFIVNRCLMPTINEAAYLLMNNIATAETIDSAIRLGANHPMGPLALADLIGIDVCLQVIREIKNRVEGSCFLVCPLLEKMVAEGNLGKKTGKGFFTYTVR